MTTLVTDAILVYQRTSMLENIRHRISGIIQQMFYHSFRLIKDETDLFDLKIVYVF
jgi:hypothetical protein